MLRAGRASLAAAICTAAAAVALTAPSAVAAPDPGPGFPAQYSAPYVETWNSPSAMTDALDSAGQKFFTLAFIIDGGGCNGSFNGDTPIDDAGWTSAVNEVRAAGGDVIASFGGASGTELGISCTSVGALKAEYKRIIDGLSLTRIDLDIEGGSLGDTEANDRRNQALAELQQEYAEDGTTLDVQYTLPVNPTGLEPDSLALLDNAKENGLDVTLVNIMTMDYGPAMDMGKAATDAATALHDQLGGIWTDASDAELWAKEGNTPMIGVNDTSEEVFTTENAATLADFARSKGIQELSFWSLGRDKSCDSGGSCSGTPQDDYEFTATFQ